MPARWSSNAVGGSLPMGGALTVNGGLFDMSQHRDRPVGGRAGAAAARQINLGANTLTTNSERQHDAGDTDHRHRRR